MQMGAKMKLRVLVDNHTYIDQYYLGEPAVCYYIEDEEEKILFDTGYSDVFIRNAEKMGIDLNKVSTIAFSHGHNDHTGGFAFFQKKFDVSDKKVVAHPDAFVEKYFKKEDFEKEEIGAPFSVEEMSGLCKLHLTVNPCLISKHITYLGEIPSYFDFEKRSGIGEQKIENGYAKDLVLDDTALVYQSKEGLFIITGCSHSGICNIIEHAKKVCGDERIIAVLGGFHMFHVDDRLRKTIAYLESLNIKVLYPCHCVSFKVKAEMNQTLQVKEVGVGMKLEV